MLDPIPPSLFLLPPTLVRPSVLICGRNASPQASPRPRYVRPGRRRPCRRTGAPRRAHAAPDPRRVRGAGAYRRRGPPPAQGDRGRPTPLHFPLWAAPPPPPAPGGGGGGGQPWGGGRRLLRKAIEAGEPPSMVLWGPPGSGKTTLARIIAGLTHSHFEPVSAVSSGVADLRRLVAEAKERQGMTEQKTILFID